MKKELALVKQFHNKFGGPVLSAPSLIPHDRSDFRYQLMRDEVAEYHEGVKNGDIENIAKELADILFSVYGTILEHGLQDVMEEVFEEAHRSNMSKDYHEYKMVKGRSYVRADLKRFFQDGH